MLSKRIYLIVSIIFILLSLAGTIYLAKNNQDTRNRAAGCWATCNCSCGKSFCADPKGPGCNSECASACGTTQGGPTQPISGSGCEGPLTASTCKGRGPGQPCAGFNGTCKTTTSNNCACVANNPTAPAQPTSPPSYGCTEGNLGSLCCSGATACQLYRYKDCHTTCTTNCGIFNNSVCTAPSGVTPTLLPGGGGVTWDCNKMSGSRGGYDCSGYQNCSGYRNGTPCNPGEYTGGGLQAPVGAITCPCGNGVTVIGKGASCAGLCACTNNVCTTCSPTPVKPFTAINTPTKVPTPTATPTKTPTLTPTKTPTPTPTTTGTPQPTNTPTNTPINTPTNVPTLTSIPTDTPTGTLRPTNTPTSLIAATIPVNNTTTPALIAQGPSPTRIVLPQTGIEFPIQILGILGAIVTLSGILILL